MTIQPLGQSLWETLRVARLMPERANLGELMPRIDAALAQLSTSSARMTDSARLQAAGELLLQLADLCAARAEALMTGWEETHRDPIVERGFFADVVRQTMAVDLSDLMEPVPPRKRRTKRIKPTAIQEGSIVALVDKTAVLALVEQLEMEAETHKERVLAIASDEDVTRWTSEIARWLQAVPEDFVSFAQLCHGLQMPWVEVWMGLLLGGFELEQSGEFYRSAVWVKRSMRNAAG